MRAVAIVPTYNEAPNLAAVVDRIGRAAPGLCVLVVDDASTDGTSALAHELAARTGYVDVLDRPGPRGLGAAYRAGFAWALEHGAELCVQIDGDLSHDPADLPALLAVAEAGADLVIGSRYVPGGATEGWPWRRRWLSRWGNRYVAAMLGLAVNDATAGYRVYRSSVLRLVDYGSVGADGYGFQVEMTYRVVRAGGKVVEFPVHFRDRAAGESKMSAAIVREAFGLVGRLRVADHRDRRRRRRVSG